VKDLITYTTSEAKIVLSPTDCARLLGPDKNLLLRNLPVIPLSCRPTVIGGGGRHSFHDLTHLYASVAKEAILMCIFVRTLSPAHIKKTQWARLQDVVYLVYDTSKDQKDGGLRQRLDGKQGRFRQNLLGTSKVSPSHPVKLPSY
tara:strand:- start:2527 stop:2961 length:435 start_codon:yes stop_codon:yes gene_type:complete